MITKSQLLAEHENGFDGRPQRIQRLREPLRRYCGVEVPRSVPAVMEWYDNEENKDAITDRLEDGGED